MTDHTRPNTAALVNAVLDRINLLPEHGTDRLLGRLAAMNPQLVNEALDRLEGRS